MSANRPEQQFDSVIIDQFGYFLVINFNHSLFLLEAQKGKEGQHGLDLHPMLLQQAKHSLQRQLTVPAEVVIDELTLAEEV